MLSTACHRCGISSKGAVLPTGAVTRRWAPQTRYTLQRNTVSKLKDFGFSTLANLSLFHSNKFKGVQDSFTFIIRGLKLI